MKEEGEMNNDNSLNIDAKEDNASSENEESK